ncbi:hypothetical protein WJX74_001201 [Apatococcus lobatus]|uniref:MoaB/Mog domain-containing protein n=1 Tax=Apatococcus lobatus TaxID=904363 RepID=A0AAW1S3F4_9CHLO
MAALVSEWQCPASSFLQAARSPEAKRSLSLCDQQLCNKLCDCFTNTAEACRVSCDWQRDLDRVRPRRQHPLACTAAVQGVDLIRVEYIPDDKSDIASTLLRLKERVGHKGVIFTSGGIGPTHDDITYESVAHAFGVELEVHKPTVEAMKAHYEPQGKEVNESRLRMATIPIGSEVLTTPDLWVPMACIHDVFILPGIPRLFKAMITANKDRFTGAAYLSATLYTDTGEGDVAQALRKIAAEHPDVRIGSYPNTSYDKTYQVKLQLECRQQDLLDQAKVAVSEALTVRE